VSFVTRDNQAEGSFLAGEGLAINVPDQQDLGVPTLGQQFRQRKEDAKRVVILEDDQER